jgi:hypothetical protein
VGDSQLIVRLAENLLEALSAGDRERLLACSQETATALRKPTQTTLERELAELLSSITEELVSVLESEQAEDSSTNKLSLYRDLLTHVRAMAQLVSK